MTTDYVWHGWSDVSPIGNMSEPVSLRVRGTANTPNPKLPNPKYPTNVTLIFYVATAEGKLDVILSSESNPNKRVGDAKHVLLKQVGRNRRLFSKCELVVLEYLNCLVCVCVQGIADKDIVLLGEGTTAGDLAFVISLGTQHSCVVVGWVLCCVYAALCLSTGEDVKRPSHVKSHHWRVRDTSSPSSSNEDEVEDDDGSSTFGDGVPAHVVGTVLDEDELWKVDDVVLNDLMASRESVVEKIVLPMKQPRKPWPPSQAAIGRMLSSHTIVPLLSNTFVSTPNMCASPFTTDYVL